MLFEPVLQAVFLRKMTEDTCWFWYLFMQFQVEDFTLTLLCYEYKFAALQCFFWGFLFIFVSLVV
jgi:hypothetical protein